MIYQKFTPAPVLQPFIECYYIWESEGRLTEEFVVESPPNGYCSLVFNCGDPYLLQTYKYEKRTAPRNFVAGQAIYSYKLFMTGTIAIAGIVVKPAALATLFRLPAYQYTEERTDLLHVFDPAYLEPFIRAIENARTSLERVQAMETFVQDQYRKNDPVPDAIDVAVEQIIQRRGMVDVGQLVQKSYMSRRTFERRFFQKVGLSPKFYARVRRISFICNAIAGKKEANWTDLLYEFEFYDQAHFIKDFEEFTGRSPQQYLKENRELARYVDKPKEQNRT